MMALPMLTETFTGYAMRTRFQKDIIVRSKSMSGFFTPLIYSRVRYHGLPIEQVLAKQGVKRMSFLMGLILETCRIIFLDKQREDFKSA